MRQAPQAADHRRERDAVGHRGGDGGSCHTGQRQQGKEQHHSENRGQPLGGSHQGGAIPAAQQVTHHLAAGEENPPGCQDPQQRHRAAVRRTEDQGDQPGRTDGRREQEAYGQCRATQDRGSLQTAAARGDQLLGGEAGKRHIADGHHQRDRKQGDRNRDGVAAQISRGHNLGEHQLIQVEVQRRRGQGGHLGQPVSRQRPDELLAGAARSQPGGAAGTVGQAQLDRKRGDQDDGGRVQGQVPELPQQDDPGHAEHRLADPDQVPPLQAAGLERERVAAGDERDDRTCEDDPVGVGEPRLPVRQDRCQ